MECVVCVVYGVFDLWDDCTVLYWCSWGFNAVDSRVCTSSIVP